MNILKSYLLFILALGLMAGACEREGQEQEEPVVDLNPFHRMLFYNVENLFDTLDQPETRDEEFMPGSDKEWNTDKLFDKVFKIAKVVEDAGDGTWPPLIGLCEVENRDVLELMLASTNMKAAGYEIVHKESPDYRGIDVALLYRTDLFDLQSYSLYQVWFPFNAGYSTREVLYAKGNLAGTGEIHLFVNHWPSRSGGEIESRPKRIFVAELVRTKVDSIFGQDPKARIIITGDFNDEPDDLSIVSGLNGLHSYDKPKDGNLYAISKYLMENSSIGSYKYKGDWNSLDQFVVSGALLDTTGSIYCRPSDLGIIERHYLFQEDNTYMGKKPFRTYLGDYFNGGYSDHLPVELKLRYRD
jgi:hypothetical protein